MNAKIPLPGEPAPDSLAEVYRRRAVELAARTEQGGEPAGTVAALAFTLQGERYGLELADLDGVLIERFTPIPGAQPELRGVIHHRGQVCSVLDLARLLGLPAAPAPEDAEPACILLLRRPGREVGLLVGRVEGLLRIAPETGPRNAEPGGEGAAGPYLKTLTADRLRLLSTDALLSHPVFKGP
jgi:chemotaxis signal transduction protein